MSNVLKLNWSKQVREDIVTAIQMRMNFVETGDILLSANDAVNYNSGLRDKGLLLPTPKPKAIKALSREQRDLLNTLEDAVKDLTQEN